MVTVREAPVDTTTARPVVRSRTIAAARRLGFADPLVRNAHLLSISSAITSVVGLVYWAIAARRYDTATVGQNAAAVSAMMLIGGLSQLNLMSAVTRFVPAAGHRARALVLGAYAVSIGVALVASSIFLLLLDRLAPNLRSLLDGRWMSATFVLSTMAWCVFVLQDSALAAVRKAQWVAYENAAFALAKVGLVVVLALALPRRGIFVSWSLALVVSLVLSNVYLFTRAMPAHARAGTAHAGPAIDVRAIARFTALDYVGALLWILATSLVPILIINARGARASAYFSIAWLIASSLYFVSANMGISLVVETSVDQSALVERCRDVVRHSGALIAAGAAVLILGAPYFLRVFGSDYASHGSAPLRLLALSALPNIVTATAVSACRAQRRTGAAVVILVCLCGSVLVGTMVLLPVAGIAGVAYAWLGAQCVVAAALAARRSWWLPRRPSAAEVGSSGMGRSIER